MLVFINGKSNYSDWTSYCRKYIYFPLLHGTSSSTSKAYAYFSMCSNYIAKIKRNIPFSCQNIYFIEKMYCLLVKTKINPLQKIYINIKSLAKMVLIYNSAKKKIYSLLSSILKSTFLSGSTWSYQGVWKAMT